MNEQIKGILNRFQPPTLQIHRTVESIFNEHWNFEKDMTLEELLKCETGSHDDEPMGTLADMLEDTRMNKFWAFMALKENILHIWFDEKPDMETLLVLIGHEVGHIFEEKFDAKKKRSEGAEYMRHENNADIWGASAAMTYQLANQFLEQFDKAEDHILTIDCPCLPTLDETGLIIHNSFDGREFDEIADKINGQ